MLLVLLDFFLKWTKSAEYFYFFVICLKEMQFFFFSVRKQRGLSVHQRVLPKMYLSILGKISKADLLTILLLFFNFDGGF